VGSNSQHTHRLTTCCLHTGFWLLWSKNSAWAPSSGMQGTTLQPCTPTCGVWQGCIRAPPTTCWHPSHVGGDQCIRQRAQCCNHLPTTPYQSWSCSQRYCACSHRRAALLSTLGMPFCKRLCWHQPVFSSGTETLQHLCNTQQRGARATPPHVHQCWPTHPGHHLVNPLPTTKPPLTAAGATTSTRNGLRLDQQEGRRCSMCCHTQQRRLPACLLPVLSTMDQSTMPVSPQPAGPGQKQGCSVGAWAQ
jgi:hypothetical protein